MRQQGVSVETTGRKLPPDRDSHNQTPTLVTEVANCSTGKKTQRRNTKPFSGLCSLRVGCGSRRISVFALSFCLFKQCVELTLPSDQTIAISTAELMDLGEAHADSGYSNVVKSLGLRSAGKILGPNINGRRCRVRIFRRGAGGKYLLVC